MGLRKQGKTKRRKQKKPHPPKTKRYCLICEEKTLWKYDPSIGHSRCLTCGSNITKRVVKRIKGDA